MKKRSVVFGASFLVANMLNSAVWSAQTIDTSCGMVMTSIMPSGSRTNLSNANFSTVIGFDYDTRGYQPPSSPAPTQLASAAEVGTVWGKAYNANTKKLYVAAFLRRHAPLSPDGLGAIYEIDVSNTSSNAAVGTPTLWMDLNSTTHLGSGATLFPSETDSNRGLGSPFAPSYDVWAYDKVARQGIGGLELSDDFSTLYAMDLTNRQLLVIDVATKTVTARHAISDPGCKNPNDVRPFGVDYLGGDVYVGVSCSDETAKRGNTDATAHVMRLLGGTFSNVINGSLRGYYWSHFWELNPNAVGCNPSDRGAYVPLVTNMELDESGNMIVGVTGLNGWRYAGGNYAPNTSCSSLIGAGEHSTRGFVLHATPNGNTWDVAASEETRNSNFTHHYKHGQFVHWNPGANHTFQSGMAVTSCSGQEVVMANLMDPLNHESGGLRWMRTSDAQQEAHEPSDGVVVMADKTVSEKSTLELYAGYGDTWEKSAGMGDIEYLDTPNSPVPLTINKTASTNIINSGDTIVYTVTVSNNGSDPATGIVVTDALSPNVSYLNDDGGVATTRTGSLITWTINSIAGGSNAVLNITTRAN